MADLAVLAAQTAAVHQMLKSGDTVIAACSGGADSVALFHFLYTHATRYGICLRCAHVNHAMRPGACEEDAAFVASLCAAWGVPLDVCTLRPPAGAGEAWARGERYAFFDALARRFCAKVATAHTRGDNAETVLLNLARGAGVHGAGGIPPVRGAYIRPLLCCTRAEVLEYLARHGLSHREDATNETLCYARNRMRLAALPALEQARPGAAAGLARIEKHGYYAMLYTNLYWLEEKLVYDRIQPYDIWLAQWANRPTFQHPFGMWQYTSTGLVAGVSGRVDLDEARKDYPRIIRQAGLNKLDSSVPLPPPAPEPPQPEYRYYVVRPGDTLWGIAEKELGSGFRYLEIVELNHLSGTVIYPGQILRLPPR